ncbi:hypothetical protein [Aquimarina litoralis]|uniref:hypothetical protein n=1 Tax=Aquimarina litoralis TaxID=584605 RepID=UPI001C57312F|nr:hypothetical protein [Aquimarina litoralis]MBW1296069.1 hypothetical protein [Aquimarina litoralis]
MRTTITFIALMLSTLSLSAQNQIPAKEELYGEWQLLIKDLHSEIREYILYAYTEVYKKRAIVTDAKITISKEGINKSYDVKGAWCGNDHRRMYNKAYGKQITPISYDESEGVLEVSANHIFGHTLFLLHKLPSGNIIITKIE